MAAKEKTKRRWGKSRHREKITILDRMEIEDSLQKFAEEVKSFKDRHEVAPSPQNHNLDLQQPELMSDFDLMEALKKIKVPIPVYSDGRPSRERLIYLFRQHVTPRPQRQRQGRHLQRRERKIKGNGGATEVSTFRKPGEVELDAMEVDGMSESDGHWAVGSDGNWLFPLERKRKNQDSPSTLSGAPPEKKLTLDVSSSHTLNSSSSLADVKPDSDKVQSVRKIIKLKRPARTVPAT